MLVDRWITNRILVAAIRCLAIAAIVLVLVLAVLVEETAGLSRRKELSDVGSLTTASPASGSQPASGLVLLSIPSPTPVPLLSQSGPAEQPGIPVPPTLAAPIIVASTDGANVRSGTSTESTRLGYLAPGMQAQLRARWRDWWAIEYSGAPAWASGEIVTASNADSMLALQPALSPTTPPPSPVLPPAEPWTMDEERWIDVDLSQQLLTAYERGAPVRSTPVSTGLLDTPTPVGQFRIWIKLLHDDMEGPGYYLSDVPYAMYFYKGYGLHAATWHTNFGQPMSHGCVNLPPSEAEWLFGWAGLGTLVNVHT